MVHSEWLPRARLSFSRPDTGAIPHIQALMDFRAGTKLVVMGLLLGLLFYIGFVVRAALLLIFVSIIFAVIFLPVIGWIQKWRLYHWSPGRGAAILIFLGIVLGGVALFSAIAVPPIVRDAQRMTGDLPKNLASLQQRVEQLPMGKVLSGRLNQNVLRQWIQPAVQHSLSVFQNLASGIMALLTVGLLTAYFVLDGQRAFHWSMSMVPESHRPRLERTLNQSAERMQRWLYGQFLLMLILGSSSAIVFGLLKIRYFYALAVFAGLANFVPILGPIATVILASIVAALDSWGKVLGVIIFYAAYQQVESAFLTPRIMRAEVDLPGVAVIVALTIGGELAGLAGAIAAVPTAALVATLLDEYLVRKQLTSVVSERAA
jgi:predicted PurR-regulated permease PerM